MNHLFPSTHPKSNGQPNGSQPLAQLLYFVDGSHRLTRDQAVELGLGYAFPAGQFVPAEYSAAGPGGNTGCVLGGSTDRLGYVRDRQTWLKMPPVAASLRGARPKSASQPTIHVGFWHDARPTPSDLAVPDPLRGSSVKLKDGNEWQVPIAREWTGGSGWSRTLPGVLALGDDGSWASGGVAPKFARLWEICVEFWSHLFGASLNDSNEIRFNFQGANDAALEVLAFNYRLSRAEVVLLGLFDDQLDSAATVLRALVDFDRYLTWQKKSLAEATHDGSSTFVGAAASLPSTTPPSSTSGRSKRSRKKQ